MPSNPFSRKRTPLDEARKRLDAARNETADAVRNVRDAADEVVKTLETRAPANSRLPIIGAAAAGALGIGLYVAKRVSGSSEPELPDTPPPSATAPTKSNVTAGAGPVA